jgi:spermidine/putrescine transport system substrate-binding protein
MTGPRGSRRGAEHQAPACARRTFLRGLGAAGLGAVAFGAGLGACAAPDLATVPLPRGPAGRSRERVVRFGNWLNYIDQAPADPARHPTLEEFTRRTGIAVDYSEPISSNEQFLGLIEIPLAMGWSTGYDLVVLTDWVVAELIRLGWAHPLPPRLVPNAARLLPHFRDYPVPDVSGYSLPWQGGFTGIVYNSAVTHRPVTSMRDFLTAPDLRGKVSLATEMRDVLTLVMLDMGIDPVTFTSREFTAAVTALGNAAQAGQVGLVTDYYGPALLKGSIAAAVGWSGDYLNFRVQNPHIEFTWPAAGGGLWTDNMVIPAGAQHAENAERLMNFYYEPAIAAQLSIAESYVDPVLGAADAMRRADPALAAEEYIFPTPELLRSAHFFKLLTPQQNVEYTARYQSAVGL